MNNKKTLQVLRKLLRSQTNPACREKTEKLIRALMQERLNTPIEVMAAAAKALLGKEWKTAVRYRLRQRSKFGA